MKRIHLERVDSTNLYIRRFLESGEDTAVTADVQTAGRGTKGRSFLSERGGVYMSVLTFYDGLASSDAFFIMMHAAVSVCRTAERFGLSPEIKWPNDVLVSGRKLSGILIENGITQGRVRYSIVGIGLNAENDLTPLNGIAVSMRELGVSASVSEIRETLVSCYSEPCEMRDYRARVRFLGKEIQVTEGDRSYSARALAVLPDGRLQIEEGQRIRALSAAEIRLTL